jgi:hypothetical protein
MRYGSAYFGRLAGALLARRGSSAITVALFALNVVTLLTYLIAFASPLANATHVSAYVWVGLLFAVDLFYLRRDLSATVASAIMIAVVNVLLIVLISAVALGHINMDRLGLGQMPFVGSGGVELAAVGLAFGVLMMAFFGHTSCALVARLILEREPSGKALVRGSTAAAATVICLYGLALVSFFGAVPRSELVGNAGTILEPLADRAGSAITVFGTIYILLAVGLASIYVSLGMSNQIREWLPASIRGTRASLLAVVPAAIVFVTVELLLLFDRASFSAPLALIGTLVVPLLGGVFPMLLLAASRHRGERAPSAWVRVLRGPISMGVVAAGFVLGLTLQGIFIWERPLERIATAVMIVVIGVMWWAARQRGAFKPLAVVELRQEAGDNAAVAVMVDGRAQPVDVQLTTARGEHDAVGSERFSELKAASFRLPAVAARELKVWVHGLTAEGDSMGIAAKIVLGSDGAEREIDAPTGAAVVPIDGPLHVRILLG